MTTTEPRKPREPHQPRGTIDPSRAAEKARGDAIERAYAYECEPDLRDWYESLPTNQDDEATR